MHVGIGWIAHALVGDRLFVPSQIPVESPENEVRITEDGRQEIASKTVLAKHLAPSLAYQSV